MRAITFGNNLVSPQVLGQETKFHESDAGDRKEGTSEVLSDVKSGVVTELSIGIEVGSEAGG